MGRRRKKPRLIEAMTVVGPADKGRCVAKNEAGDIVFLEGVAPGDVVDVMVFRKRKGVYEGSPQAFRKYSEDRVEAVCQHFGVCGGCKWQHISYAAQLRHKTDIVTNALRRIGKVEVEEMLPIVPADHTEYYRNKLEFSFSNKRWLEEGELNTDVSNRQDVLGFHRPRTFDKIIDIQHCHLQADPSNAIRDFVREKAKEMQLPFFDIKAVEGYLRNLMIRTSSLGQTMVLLSVFDERPQELRKLLDALWEAFPDRITSLHYAVNPKRNDSLTDIDTVHYKGAPFIEEDLRGIRYRISPKSFFQTNSAQAVKLYDKVVEFAGLEGSENVYDLYTGAGSIACYMAQNCRQVVGIEEVESAVADARHNAERNRITNAVFHLGDVKDILTDAFAKEYGRPDVLVTDPPRAGMHPKVVDMLLKLEAPKIVYVSCNPATQARDLSLLSQKYRISRLQAVDMFPHTHHIESVALLDLSS